MNNWENGLRKLSAVIDNELGMNSYRLARYFNDISIDLNYFYEYNDSIWGYRFLSMDNDLRDSPKINVLKSVIDSLVSKIANQKVIPYFTPVDGTFKTRQVVKQAKQYFTQLYEKEQVHDKVTIAYKNACIFGIGYIYYNTFLDTIECPGSWSVAVSNTEKGYGTPTKLLIEYKTFPVTLLSKYNIKKEYTEEYVNFKMYYDTVVHKKYILINNIKVIEEGYKSDLIPVVPVYHNNPLFGTRTISLVDELDGLQTNVDLLNQKISAAMQLTPANTTYVEAGSSLNAEDISNKTGNIYTVKLHPNRNNLPVVNVTPAPYDPMWNQCLEMYIKMAYEIVGISQLSSQSKKPADLSSGVALQTLEDIESDRFQTQIDNYVHSFVALAELIIETKDDYILPKSNNTSTISWEAVRKQRDLYKIQFSASSALSKDPQTKLTQVLQLYQMGVLTPDKMSVYLDSPDLEELYKSQASIMDSIDNLIEKAIESNTVEIPDYIDYNKLLQRILVIQNELYAANDLKSIANLNNLREAVLQKLNDSNILDLNNEPAEQPSINQEEEEDIMAGEQPEVDQLANPIETGGV